MLFSIIIPSFKNYNYLRIAIESILKNSNHKHQIIVHVNGNDIETVTYLNNNNIEFTSSKVNLGLCRGVNIASRLAKTDYIVYAHDDMYFLPEWDQHLKNEIDLINDTKFYLSSTQIGPLPSDNLKPNHIYYNAGTNINNFNETDLLNNYKNLKFYDLQGSHWAPHVIHKEIWEKVGGFSEEFDPGFGSDPDLNMKLWKQGVRIFKGVNLSRTYHFGSQTTRKNDKIVRNNANKTFLNKWGITIDFFTKYYLNRGDVYESPLGEVKYNIFTLFRLLTCKIKLFIQKIT